MKLRFHAVLGKKDKEIYSLVKIVRVLGLSKDIFLGVCYIIIDIMHCNQTMFNSISWLQTFP